MIKTLIKNKHIFSILFFFGLTTQSTHTMMENPLLTGIFHFVAPILIFSSLTRPIEKLKTFSALSSTQQINLAIIILNMILLGYWHFMSGEGIIGKWIGLAKDHVIAYGCCIFIPLNLIPLFYLL